MYTNTVGTRAATMTARNTGNQQNATVVVSGTAVGPAILQFTAPTAMDRDFGTVLMGDTSTTVKYTITNVGGFASGPIAWKLTDDAAGATVHAKTADFVTTGTTCGASETLNGGESCDIVLAFHPTQCAVGTCTTTPAAVAVWLIVTASPGIPVPASGNPGLLLITAGPKLTGATTTSTLEVSLVENTSQKTPYDFGAATTAQTAKLLLRNLGAATVTLGALPAAATNVASAAGAVTGASEFVPSVATGDTCTFTTGTLTQNQSCTFTVTWTPVTTTTGTREVSLTIPTASTGPVSHPGTITLFGRVPTGATLTATPATLSFGKARMSLDSANMAVVVKNTGESATTGNVQTVRTTGAGSGQVNYDNGCNNVSPLAAGATCTMNVNVHPTTLGASATAGLTVQAAGAASGSIAVDWTATNAPAINPNPTSLAFNPTAVLASDTPQTITLSNPINGDATGPLSFRSDNGNFTVTADPLVTGSCGDPARAVNGLVATTSAADSCTVAVTFSPTALATPSKAGNLIVTSTSGAGAQVPLTGTAVAALAVTGHVMAATTGTPPEDAKAAAACTWTAATTSATAICAYPAASVTAATFGSETYTISNLSAQATGLILTALGGTNADQFRVVYDTCIGNSLTAAGGAAPTCKVTVRFAPTSTGAKAGTLTVSGTPGDSVTVSLSGTGNP
jgi:hypothetical protein